MSNPAKHEAPAPQKRKILMLLTNAYEPDPRVREEAVSLIAAGYRVRILAWDRDLKSSAREELEGVEIERIHLRSTHGRGAAQLLYYSRVYWRMLCMGWRNDFDAVHCHDLDTLPPGWILGKLKRRPVVYDAHESFSDMLTGSVPRWLRSLLVRLENFLIRRVDLLITVGEKLRRHFAERGARHTVVVGNWKRLEDYARTEEDNRDLRRRLGIPDPAMVIACITQLLPDREIPELLDAIDVSPNVYAIIGGAGALEAFVRERAARNPRIIYVGRVKSQNIPAFTCAADVIYYGFDPKNPNARYSAPNKLYEALAAGRPLITGDFGEIADVVRESKCGIVLSHYSPDTVRDAIEALQDRTRWKAFAENAGQYGRTAMNWSKGEQILREEYGSLLPLVGELQACAG